MPNAQQKILIVEDSALLRAVMHDALEDGGFIVLEAGDGKVGKNLGRVRVEKSIAQRDIVHSFGISQSFVSNIENE